MEQEINHKLIEPIDIAIVVVIVVVVTVMTLVFFFFKLILNLFESSLHIAFDLGVTSIVFYQLRLSITVNITTIKSIVAATMVITVIIISIMVIINLVVIFTFPANIIIINAVSLLATTIIKPILAICLTFATATTIITTITIKEVTFIPPLDSITKEAINSKLLLLSHFSLSSYWVILLSIAFNSMKLSYFP